MKVQYAPLVSDARGRFGGLVMSAWRATRTARRFRAPSNPKTTLQVNVRRIFINCCRWWLKNGVRTRAAWVTYAQGKNFQGRNALVAREVPALKLSATLGPFVGTPGDASTLPPVSVNVVPGAGILTATVVAPAIPTGWTLTCIAGFAVKDTDWRTLGVDVAQTEMEDVVTPFVLVFSGLATVLYQVRCWCVWLAPDATERHSACVVGSGTPT